MSFNGQTEISESPSSVIYFPHIKVPNSKWSMQVLLYWDKVYSIVPGDILKRPDELGQRMRNLIDEGLVNPIVPKDYVEHGHFTQGFIDFLDSQYGSPRGPMKRIEKSGIHYEKLPSDLLEELIARGLASRGDGIWCDVESHTADQYMTYLAGFLGRQINARPITDNLNDFGSLNPDYNLNYNRFDSEIEQMRGTILLDVLPMPGGINAEEISNFKKDHKKELTRFRDEIELFLPDLANTSNLSVREKKLSQFKTRMNHRINELSEDMKSRGWTNITTEKLFIYLPVLAGLLAATMAGGPVGIAAGALGFIGTAYSDHMRRDDLLRNNDFAYAYLAKERFGGRA